MSEQGRKQEDISVHKSSRTNTSIAPGQLGVTTPSLLTYSLQPHEYTPHHRLYTMMRPGTISMQPSMAQPIQTAKPCLTNDMGPPIFMPSLNLGTPKSSSMSAASSPLPSSPAAASSPSATITTISGSVSVGGPILAHSMSDMILSNAPSVSGFHSLPNFYTGSPGIRTGSGQPQYMSIPTAPPQASTVVTNKRSSVSTATIAKPTPVQAGHSSKVGTFSKSHPGHPPPSVAASKGGGASPLPPNKTVMLVTSSTGLIPATITSSSQTVTNFPPGSTVIKHPASQSRQPQIHHHHGQLQSQQASSVSVHPGPQSGQQSQSYPAGKQQKLYISAPPTHTPPEGGTNPESMGTVFFPHPAMQGHVIPVAYQTMIQTHGGLATGGNVQQPAAHSASSTLTELLAPGSAVTSSSAREGGGKQGKMHDVGMQPYSPGQQQHHTTAIRYGPTAVRERSSSGDAASGGSLMSPQPGAESVSRSTSAQPTPTADHIDTRVERPAQPSSSGSSAQIPSPQGVPSPYQGPHRERSNSTEVSNIIISVPGLTGRHIAAISSHQTPGFPPNGSQTQPIPSQQQQQSSDPYRGSRVKSEYGGQAIDSPSHPTSLHIPPQSASSQNPTTSTAGGKSPHHPVPAFGQLSTPQSALTATVISSSASSSPSVHSPMGPHPNSVPLSVSGSPLANVSPSRRPGIFRKRPYESNLRVDIASSPNLSKPPLGSSMPAGHGSRNDQSPHSSHPLSPPISTHTSHHHGEPLTNHVTAGLSDSASSTAGDVFPSPRKKRRKQDVIVTDDQYASNVPNHIRPDVAMAIDGDHLPSSTTLQGTAVTMVTRVRGRSDEPSNELEEKVSPSVSTPPHFPPPEPERVEVRYLSQLRQPQWPINGMYRMHCRAAHNHFKRHADIKHIEMETVTATSIANNKTSVSRATGWKIYRLDPQLEEMLQVEKDILEMMRKVEASISNLSQCASCPVSNEVLSGIEEIVQGNVARSNCITSHLEATRSKMVKLLEHKPTVMDLLLKYSTTKRSSPINSLPHKLRT